MRLRSTAFLAARLETVKPRRAAPSSSRRRASSTKAPRAAFGPFAAATKSRLFFRRSIMRPDRSRRQALAPLGAAAGDHLGSVPGRHPGAEAMAALANQAARLIGSLHCSTPPSRRPSSLNEQPARCRETLPRRMFGVMPERACLQGSDRRARYRVKPPGKSTSGGGRRNASRRGDTGPGRLHKFVLPILPGAGRVEWRASGKERCRGPTPRPATMDTLRRTQVPNAPTERLAAARRASGGFALLRWAPLAAVAIGLGLLYALDLHHYLSLEALRRYQASLAELVEERPAFAAAAYVTVYIATVALSFPGASALTAAGGLMFGCIAGTALALVAATIGATLIFLIARTSLGDFLAARAGPRAQRLRAGFREEGFLYLLFLRLVPLFPFW